MIGVLWGLLGAGLIGGSDCVARVTASRVSITVLFLFVMGLSFTALTGYCIVTGDWPQWHLWGWTASFISGWLSLIALYYLYVALARGPVTIASPAASTFSLLLVAINVAAGQPFTWIQGVAVIVTFFGVAMLARVGESSDGDKFDAAWRRTTMWFGLLSALAISVRMFLAQEATDALGIMPALYLNRGFALVAVLAIIFVVIKRGDPLTWPTGSILGLVLLQSVLESMSMAAFMQGSVSGGRIGTAIGFSAFSAVTALVAWAWLKEPIGYKRGFWMLVVASGIVLGVYGSA